MLAFLLSALVGWSALSVVVRLRLDGRAETVAGATVLASSMVLGPIYVLGTTGLLTRGALAASVLTVAAIAWVLSNRGAGVRLHQRDTWHALAGIARMPGQGLAEAWRTRSAVLPCLVACGVIFIWCLAAAYLAPSWREWDALWYHEPIVGFAIQNHGFAPVDLPLGGMQKINGYPRASEMLSLWLAMYGGRALIDMPNVLLLPMLFASVFAMARRLGGDRLTSAGWAAVSCLIPANVELLQSIYVDPALAAFIAAGAMFVLRSPARSREALLGAAALAIAANIKVSGVFAVVPLAVVAVVVQLKGSAGRRGKALGTLAAGAAIIVTLSSATYLANLRKYHNPVWPDLRVQVPSLGIDWPGNGAFGVVRTESKAAGGGVTKNVPLPQLFGDMYMFPGRLKDDEQRYIHMYGMGVPWVLIPAALFVALRLAGSVLRRGALDPRARSRLFEVLALLFVCGVALLLSTNRATPRYQLATIAMWVPVVAWTFGRRRALQEAMVLAATIGSLMVIVWEAPGWRGFPSARDLFALWKLDPPLREMTPELGGTVLRDPGVARERELVAGSMVLSDDFVFPSVLWNNDYSNRVVYVRPNVDLAATADRLGATWIYAQDKGDMERVRDSHAWEEIGPLYVERWGVAFTRAH